MKRILIATVLVFAAVAFIEAEINPFNWTSGTRGAFVFSALIVNGFAYVAHQIIEGLKGR